MIAGATPIRASVSAKVLRGPATAMSQAPTRAEAAGPDVPVDGGDHRQRRLDDVAQQRGHFPGPRHRRVVRVAPPASLEIRTGAERSAGVPEHHHPHRRVRGGIAQPLMQLSDQRGGQRVAVVGRVQRQPRERASAGVRAGVLDERCPSVGLQ